MENFVWSIGNLIGAGKQSNDEEELFDLKRLRENLRHDTEPELTQEKSYEEVPNRHCDSNESRQGKNFGSLVAEKAIFALGSILGADKQNQGEEIHFYRRDNDIGMRAVSTNEAYESEVQNENGDDDEWSWNDEDQEEKEAPVDVAEADEDMSNEEQAVPAASNEGMISIGNEVKENTIEEEYLGHDGVECDGDADGDIRIALDRDCDDGATVSVISDHSNVSNAQQQDEAYDPHAAPSTLLQVDEEAASGAGITAAIPFNGHSIITEQADNETVACRQEGCRSCDDSDAVNSFHNHSEDEPPDEATENTSSIDTKNADVEIITTTEATDSNCGNDNGNDSEISEDDNW
jgi:hypothetical protein